MTSAIAKAIILSHVISLMFGSIAYTGSYQDMGCQFLLKEVHTCWNKYVSLPVCKNAYDPLVQCAETQIDAAERKDCSSDIQDDLRMFWKIYIIMRESLCSDDYLYSEFIARSSCWSVVRNCSGVVALTLHRDKEDECSSHLENMQICYAKSQTCSDILHRYGAALASGTPCSEMIEVDFLQIKRYEKTNAAVYPTFHALTLITALLLVFMKCINN